MNCNAVSARPDAEILCYPVITGESPYADTWLFN